MKLLLYISTQKFFYFTFFESYIFWPQKGSLCIMYAYFTFGTLKLKLGRNGSAWSVFNSFQMQLQYSIPILDKWMSSVSEHAYRKNNLFLRPLIKTETIIIDAHYSRKKFASHNWYINYYGQNNKLLQYCDGDLKSPYNTMI